MRLNYHQTVSKYKVILEDGMNWNQRASGPAHHQSLTLIIIVVRRTVEVRVGVVVSHVAVLATIWQCSTPSFAIESRTVGVLVWLEVGWLLKIITLNHYIIIIV